MKIFVYDGGDEESVTFILSKGDQHMDLWYHRICESNSLVAGLTVLLDVHVYRIISIDIGCKNHQTLASPLEKSSPEAF